MKTEIEIDDYLSEDEKKELAKEAFKELCKQTLIPKAGSGNAEAEIVRIAGNAAYASVIDEINSIYNTDMRQRIKEGVMKILEKGDYKFTMFYHDRYGYGDDAVGYTIMKDCVQKNREMIEQHVKSAIENFDYNKEVAAAVADRVEEMADCFYQAANKFRDMVISKSK